MGQDALVTAVTAGVALVAMATGRARAPLALGGALTALLLAGVVSPARALSGLANEGLATIALLLLVAAAVQRTGVLRPIGRFLVGDGTRRHWTQARLALPLAAMSAFLNNTPIVAMMTPELREAARRKQLAVSRYLIPLSYATILGGMCTLIGTSSMLVVDGMLRDSGLPGFGIFDVSVIGVPAALAGIATVIALAPFLLPERHGADESLAQPHLFMAELVVDADGPLPGRRLGDLRLGDERTLTPLEIRRGDRALPAPEPDDVLEGGDRLVVTAPLAELASAQAVPGLRFSAVDAGAADPRGRQLVETVVTARCPLIGGAVGDGSFRRRYGAAVVAVEREGRAVEAGPQSTWRLRAGDRLLVDAGRDFAKLAATHGDLVMLSPAITPAQAPLWQRWGAVLVLAAMVASAAAGAASMFVAALGAVVAFFAIGLLRIDDIGRELDLELLATIAAALGIGAAVQESGLAALIATELAAIAGGDLRSSIAAIYVATALLTELATNAAAAVVMLPIALSTAASLGAPWPVFAMPVAIAASASFLTPIGYQTNLLVYGAGGYRFTDFMRLGTPVAIAVAITTIWLAPSLATP